MYRKNVQLLSIFNFLIGLGFFAPLAIIYFTRVSGSYILGASVFGITMLASSIFEVPTGIWSDKIGRKQTIIAGSWARLVAFIAYAIGLSYIWLVIGAVFEGLSRALYSGNNNAFLYDTLADDGVSNEYQEHLGKTSSSEQLAWGISAVIGGVLASYSFPLLMWVTVIPQIALVCISYYFIDPKNRTNTSNIFAHTKDAVKLFIRNKKLRLLSIASMISFATSELTFQFRGAFFNLLWPVWAIGLASSLANFGASLSFYFSDKIIKRFQAFTVLFIRSLVGKIVYLAALIYPSILSPALMSSVSLMYGAGEVAENTLMQEEFTDTQRATMSSLNSLGGSIGFAIMSLVLGGFADAWGPRFAMIIFTMLAVPVTVIYWGLFHHNKAQNL